MDIPTKIRLAETYAKISEAELARRIGTTPQAFGKRMKTGKFTTAELDTIAGALGAEFKYSFSFPDGTEIQKALVCTGAFFAYDLWKGYL